jgi:chromate reductase
MAYIPRIIALAGSLRAESYNKKLIKVAIEGAKKAGAQVTYIDLKDYSMPVYEEEIEKNAFPENAIKLKKIFLEHEGLLISSPEYNSSISGVLKNTIDWLSRTYGSETPLACFNNKVASLMSASPGSLGGLRGLVHVRSILGNINVLVLPQQVAVSKASEAFDQNNMLKDSKLAASVEKLGANLANMLIQLKK